MKRVVVSVLLLSCCSPALFAQRGTGEISGTVKDPSGRILVRTKIAAVEINTSSVRNTLTNDEGLYSFPGLQSGDYEVSVEVAGFTRFSARVHVAVGSHIPMDPILSLKPIQNNLTVLGEGGIQVETQTQMLSQVISGLQLTELPTLTRNPYDLAVLAGDISPGDPAGLGVGVAINGQRAASTNITLDGAENTNSYEATVGQAVPLDSVSEFRISQSTFTAEYGRASGGMVDVETRSGANQFHGSLYEFNRIAAFAANSYDNNAHELPRAVFTRNQFGYAAGGPILKDRLFFFQSTEWTRVRSEQTLYNLVPTPEFIADAASATIAYFTKFASDNPINGTIYTKADLLAQGVVPNPGGPFDALPVDTSVFGTAFYRAFTDAGGGAPQNSYSSVARLDLNVSHKTKLFGRFALEKQSSLSGVNFSSPYPGYDESSQTFNKNALLNVTHVFSSVFVSQTRVAFDRLDQQDPLGSAPVGPALNFAGGFNLFGIPLVLPGYPGSADGLTQYEWQFDQSVTWTRGKHQLRAGGQFFYIRNNATGLNGTLPTQQLALQAADSFDNFLLGQVHSFFAAINPQGKFPCYKTAAGDPIQTPACTLNLPLQSPTSLLTTFSRNGAAYAQDSWRALKRLTLNLGLRWEYYGVEYTNDQNLASNFYLGAGSNFAERIRNGQVLTVPNSPRHRLWNPKYTNLGPRAGFAWDLFGDGKTSLRGGYGISYEGNYGRVYRNLALNPPTYSFADLFAGTPLYPTIPVSTENLGPFAGSSGSIAFPDSPAFQVNADLKTAYAEVWSLSLERQLLPSTVFSLAYTGSHGVNLYSRYLTDLPGAGVVYGGDDPNVNPLSTLSRQYEAIFTRGNSASSIYHALLAKLQGHNVRNTGLTFTANYTFSHIIDDSSSTLNYFPGDTNFGFLDPLNPLLDRGDAEFDIRNSFVASAIWQEPFFRAAPNRWQRMALDGWTLSSIFNALTGTPFTLYDCTNANLRCPRYIPTAPIPSSGHPVPTGNPNFFEYIPLSSPVPYANPLTGISDFGNCALVSAPPCPFPAAMTRRDYFRGPGTWSLDLGIYKTFQPHEGWSLQFRGELFNALNHPNFFADTSDSDVSVLSQPYISAAKSGNRNVQLAIKLTF